MLEKYLYLYLNYNYVARVTLTYTLTFPVFILLFMLKLKLETVFFHMFKWCKMNYRQTKDRLKVESCMTSLPPWMLQLIFCT